MLFRSATKPFLDLYVRFLFNTKSKSGVLIIKTCSEIVYDTINPLKTLKKSKINFNQISSGEIVTIHK